MTNPTDTNQASEEELRKKIRDEVMEHGIDVSGFRVGKSPDEATDSIMQLIRTEKLKLLAEVRERVIGDNDRYTITNHSSSRYGEQYESTMADKEELRAALIKLEAEL